MAQAISSTTGPAVKRDALNEANANVYRRELDALGVDYHSSGKGIIVPLQWADGESADRKDGNRQYGYQL